MRSWLPVLALLALGCSVAPVGVLQPPPDATAAQDGPPVCVPGAQVACACVGGAMGAQVCAADGRALGPCTCPTVDASASTDAVDAVAPDAAVAEDRPDAPSVADAPHAPDAPDAGGGRDAGCDAAVAVDPANCGACGNVCPIRPGAAPSCASGRCVSTCVAGALDCDRMPENGCEVDALRSRANCGACGRACEADRECVMAQCLLPCAAGQTRCDGNVCRDTQTDTNNCGACGISCGGAAPCRSGVCDCGPGQTICRTADSISCFNLRTSDFNCGACGNRCSEGARCVNGTCER